MATQHDLAESFQLRSTTGWQTLQAILQSTGERIPKRPWAAGETDIADDVSAAHGVPSHRGDTDERLAKRIAAIRLADESQWPGPS